MLCAFLGIVFLTGGSSRYDVQSLIILQPIAVLTCGCALTTIRPQHLEGRWGLVVSVMLVAAIAAAHVLSLPSELQSLVVDKHQINLLKSLEGVEGVWRPLTASPIKGWHALASLAVPFAVFLLGVQLSRDDLFRLLTAVIVIGAISGMLGLLQIVGGQSSPLYLYRITNFDSAVGFFANRNHAAVFLACLFPMLAAFANDNNKEGRRTSRSVLAVAIALVLLPLILVTGSRAGLLAAVIGLLSGIAIYRGPRQSGTAQTSKAPFFVGAVPLAGATLAICLVSLTVIFSRALAIDRFFGNEGSADDRIEFWNASIEIFKKLLPVGSGSGSFSEIFQMYEPTKLLDPTYLNRAHNDWIEIAVTLGIPGLLLIAIFVWLYIRTSIVVWQLHDQGLSTTYARAASAVLAILAVTSAFDYPMRTPAFMAVIPIVLLWFVEPTRRFLLTERDRLSSIHEP